MFFHKLFLLSGSPRRRELSGYLFKNIEFFSPKGDEPRPANNEAPSRYLRRTLDFKWQGSFEFLSQRAQKSDLALCADTIVVLGDQILGKPKNIAEAKKMLCRMSSKIHWVYTGLYVAQKMDSQWKEKTYVFKSAIEFKKLSEIEMKQYLKTGDSLDKAGAYGAQGAAIKFVRSIQGSYTNIVGLPLYELKQLLVKDFQCQNS